MYKNGSYHCKRSRKGPSCSDGLSNVTKKVTKPRIVQKMQKTSKLVVWRIRKMHISEIHKTSHIFQLDCCFIDVLTIFPEQRHIIVFFVLQLIIVKSSDFLLN